MVPLPSELGHAAVAELADAQDLKSCGTYTPVPVRFRFAAVDSERSEFFFCKVYKNVKKEKKMLTGDDRMC